MQTSRPSTTRAVLKRTTAAFGAAALMTIGLTAGPAGADDEDNSNDDAEIEVSPDEVMIGEELTVGGDDFASDTEVELTYTDSGDGQFDAEQATTDEDGQFSQVFDVPDDTEPGSLVVAADDGEHEASDTTEVIDDEDTEESEPAQDDEGETADDDEVKLNFVGINDLHGRISTDDGPGAEAVAAAVEAQREDDDATQFVSAGDNFGGSTFVSMINDEDPTVDVLNTIGLDASSFGNHEFDQGEDVIRDRIAGNEKSDEKCEELGEEPGCSYEEIEYPLLAANVYEKGTNELAFEPTADVEIEVGDEEDSDVTVRYIGLVTDETPSLVTPAGIEDLDFADPLGPALELAEEADDDPDVDVVVVLTHDGVSDGEALIDDPDEGAPDFAHFAAELTEDDNVDAIFSGHTHVQYERKVNDVPVIQTGSFAEALGKITLTYDTAEGEVTEDPEPDTALIDLDGFDIPEENDVVSEVQSIVAEAEAKADELGSEIIGEASADLNRAKKGNGEENRGGESTLGNLIADAQVWATENADAVEDADIAIMNPGGIRDDIGEGEVSYQEVATVQPFGNTLETFDLSGAQIRQVLEEQWQPDGASRAFLKLGLSGLTYFYDPQAEDGEHVTTVLVEGDNGPQELDEEATYRVVANNFLASGGDNFVTLAEGADYADTGMNDLEAFVDYFEAVGQEGDPVVPDFTQRAIGVHWVSEEGTAYGEGDEIALDLSSLAFSTTEPKPEELGLRLVDPDGEEEIDLGTTPVDSTVAEDATDDEVGQAEVRAYVPEVDSCLSEEAVWHLEMEEDTNDYAFFTEVALAAQHDAEDEACGGAGEEPSDGAGGALPETGTEVGGPLAGGAVLLGLGGLLLALRRRYGSLV